jgi:LysM repeat protein
MKKFFAAHGKVWGGFILFGAGVLMLSGCQSGTVLSRLQSQPKEPLLASRGVIPAPYVAPSGMLAPSEPVIGPDQLLPEEPVLLPEGPEGIETAMLPEIELPPVVETSAETYAVQKGDSLWKIGRMYGVSFRELAAYNNMKETDVLFVGKVLNIPPGGKLIPVAERPTVSPAPAAPTTALASGGKHTVQKGDSLWKISRAYGVKINDIRALNNLQSDVLQVGQVLLIPRGGELVTPPSAPQVPELLPEIPEAPTAPEVPAAPEVTEPPALVTEPAALPNLLDHTVTEGDTLDSIAEMYGTSVEAIKKANPTLGTDADLTVNMKILVPFE